MPKYHHGVLSGIGSLAASSYPLSMNFDYCFMKRVPGVFIFVMLITMACSSAQELPPLPAPNTGPDSAESVKDDVPDKEMIPTDSDVMSHVFSAEILGSEGDFSGAAARYLEAALLSEDPEIAERATRIAVSAGEWQMVALASDRWAMLDPGSLDARELAAGSRLKEGDYVGAEYQLARLLEITTSDKALGWRIVTSLLAPAPDQARATKVLDSLMKDFGADSNVDILIARSQLAARNRNFEQAVILANTAIELDPENTDSLIWAGRLAISMGNDALALSRYRQAWKTIPQDRQIAMAYAELLKRNNDLTAAQAVLAQLPDTPDMRFARIVFALDANDRDTAKSLYKGFSRSKYVETPEAAFQAAQSAEVLEFHREAIDWYKQVTGELSLRAVMRQAFLLANLGEIEEARTLLTGLRKEAGSGIRSQSYQAEAQILQGAGRQDEALKVLNDAMAVLPEDIPVRYARALLAVTLGQLDLAERDLRQIILAQPDNAAAINALGYTLADLTERYEEAEQLIQQAYQLQPEDPSIIDSMGWISYRLGRLDEAEAYMREAWKLLRNAEVAAHLGEVLWARGQKDEARSLWILGAQMPGDNKTLVETMKRFGEAP
jgi:tetratricopeptide (TPR) repeat protein